MSYWYGPCERVPWRSQRDNPVDAAKQCNVTALIMAIAGSALCLPDTQGEQPEAVLARFAETDPRVMQYMQKFQGWAVNLGWPPYTEQHTLAVAANLWLGPDDKPGPVCYETDRPLEAVVVDLVRGHCSVVTGRFTPGGHLVAVVGVHTAQWFANGPKPADVSLSSVQQFMVHDPWGNWHSGYRDHDGARCLFTPDELMRLVLTEGKNAKWVHWIA